jgi:hypothetical protein
MKSLRFVRVIGLCFLLTAMSMPAFAEDPHQKKSAEVGQDDVPSKIDKQNKKMDQTEKKDEGKNQVGTQGKRPLRNPDFERDY